MNDIKRLRESLEDSNELLEELARLGEWWDAAKHQITDNKESLAILASPPRNCDRYNSGDPVKDADDAYAEWQRRCDAADMPPSCKVESAFRQWLFATAKPGAKGESDGGK